MNCLKSRERGFTLVELLIVTVVIVTLMGIVFRLAGVGGDSRAQAETVKRLQRVENALSGYYAAYGSYPPVPLQGRSRDVTVQVNLLGVQYPPDNTAPVTLSSTFKLPTEKGITEEEKRIWRQIEAACRAQPVAVLYPFYGEGTQKSRDDAMISAIKATKSGGETAGFENVRNPGGLEYDKPNWQDVNLFQFGLLSFLLPRYQFMLRGDKNLYDAGGKGQWEANNQLPCKMDGERFTSWAENSESVKAYVCDEGNDVRKAALVASLPSQAVCARWMPNFAGIITGGDDFYGVDTKDSDRPYLSGNIYDGVPGDRKWVRKASSSGYKGGERPDYILDGMTIVDGWNHELYYYSEAPYQSYRLWSAGKNGVTFPPWLDRENVEKTMGGKSALEAVAKWTKDDISHLTTE